MYSNTLTHISSHTYTHTNHTPFILTHPEMLTLISNTLTHALAHSHLLPDSHSNTPILIFKDEYALSHRHTDSHNSTHTHIFKHNSLTLIYSCTETHTHLPSPPTPSV